MMVAGVDPHKSTHTAAVVGPVAPTDLATDQARHQIWLASTSMSGFVNSVF
jgi:hypothetical protein